MKTQSTLGHLKISVLLADDQEIFLTGLIRTVRNLKYVSKICTAKNAKEVSAVLENMHIDAVIISNTLPGINSSNTLKKISKNYPDTKIIGFGTAADASSIISFMQEGANGFFLKSSTRADLRKSLVAVFAGKKYFSPAVQETVNNYTSEDTFFSINNISFFKSKRLRDLLLLICKEFTTKEIAQELNLTEKTVEKYKAELMRATGTKSAVGLAVYAVKNNLLDEISLERK
jgi:DNA-binding NarL/FixJ family response regulator